MPRQGSVVTESVMRRACGLGFVLHKRVRLVRLAPRMKARRRSIEPREIIRIDQVRQLHQGKGGKDLTGGDRGNGDAKAAEDCRSPRPVGIRARWVFVSAVGDGA